LATCRRGSRVGRERPGPVGGRPQTPGEEFDVSLTELSSRHDIRPLVVKTAVTYLELAGAFRQGTPFYAGYEARPLLAVGEIVAKFEGERGRFVEGLFQHAKRGRIWYALQPDKVAEVLAAPRSRVLRALEYLEEQGFIELRASDARMRFRRLAKPEDAAELTEMLKLRFSRREKLAIAQIEDVVGIVTKDSCQTNALVAHFGEVRMKPCGHCSFCQRAHGERLADDASPPPIQAQVDEVEVRRVAAAEPRALGEARQLARFLCRLSSPAVVSAKLTRHGLYGALEGYRFHEVLAWCEGLR
jgi:ATP-dependent DNA helicase RecQ